MRLLSYLLPALLLTLAGCHHQADPAPAPTPAPSRATLLTARPWLVVSQSLVVNGYEGVQLVRVADATITTFVADGTLLTKQATSTDPPHAAGTWRLLSNDTQLELPVGITLMAFQVFELSATKLSYGPRFDQAMVQQQLAASGSNAVKSLVASQSSYTFPAGTPAVQPSEITSLEYHTNYAGQ